MANLLQDFEAYFTSKGLIDAGAFFRDTIPDLPDTAVAIYEYAGLAGVPQIPSVDRSIQIVTRDLSATNARSKCFDFYHALQSDEGIVNLTDTRWCMLIPKQPPFKLKVDDKERIYYCFNIELTTFSD